MSLPPERIPFAGPHGILSDGVSEFWLVSQHANEHIASLQSRCLLRNELRYEIADRQAFFAGGPFDSGKRPVIQLDLYSRHLACLVPGTHRNMDYAFELDAILACTGFYVKERRSQS